MPQLLGLTGGIACGKSTFAAMLVERGVVVIDADQVARDVVAPGSEGLAAVVGRFGDGMLGADGALDRARLGQRVFSDAAARADLEAILHPRIGAESARRIAAAFATGADLVVYDAALLVENGQHRAFGDLIVVTCTEAQQLARAIARGLSETEARARIASQLPLADKVAVADHVIDNSGSRQELEAQADALVARLRGRQD